MLIISNLQYLIMAATIKLFRFVQNSYHSMGIHLMQQTNRVFSRKFLFSLTIVLATISYFGYFLLESSNIGEYGQNFYRSMSICSALIDYFITVSKMSIISQFIEMCEEFIEKSKWKFWWIFFIGGKFMN